MSLLKFQIDDVLLKVWEHELKLNPLPKLNMLIYRLVLKLRPLSVKLLYVHILYSVVVKLR